jgi:hypothetical protein
MQMLQLHGLTRQLKTNSTLAISFNLTSMRSAAAGKWQGQSRNKQVRGQSPTRVERVPLTICSFVRHNLSYYDYNQIKWAKTVHYLLESKQFD